MISLKDILDLLDRWGEWKKLRAAPGQIEALEKRVAALEAKAADGSHPAEPCPLCGGELKLIAEVDDAEFGFAGLKQRSYRCESCGKLTKRQVDPARRK